MGTDATVQASTPALASVPVAFYRGPAVKSDSAAALAPVPTSGPTTPGGPAARGAAPPAAAAPRQPAPAVVIALGLPPPEAPAPAAAAEDEDDGLASQLGGPGRLLSAPELDASAARATTAAPERIPEEEDQQAGTELPEGDDPELLELVAALGGGAATDTELRAALKRVVAGGTPLSAARTPAEAAAAAFAWNDESERLGATSAQGGRRSAEPRDTDMRDASDDGNAEWGEREEEQYDEEEEVTIAPVVIEEEAPRPESRKRDGINALIEEETAAVELPAPAPVVTDNYDVGSDGEREPGEEAAELVVALEQVGGVPAVEARPAVLIREPEPEVIPEGVTLDLDVRDEAVGVRLRVSETSNLRVSETASKEDGPVRGRPAIYVGDVPGEPVVPTGPAIVAQPRAPVSAEDAEVALVMQTLDVPIPSPRDDMETDEASTPMVQPQPPSPERELPFEYDDLTKPAKAEDESLSRIGSPKGGFREVGPSPTPSDAGSVTLAALSRVAAAAEAAAVAAAAAAREAAAAAAMARAARAGRLAPEAAQQQQEQQQQQQYQYVQYQEQAPAAPMAQQRSLPQVRVAMGSPRAVVPYPPSQAYSVSEAGDLMLSPGAALATFTGGERFIALRLGPKAATEEEEDAAAVDEAPKRPGSPKKEVGSPKAGAAKKEKDGKDAKEKDEPTSVEYSFVALPDGRVLSSGCGNVAHVWDAASGACVLELKGHAGRAWAVAASGDGQLLYTGAWDGEVRAWQADNGVCAAALKGHTDRVWALATLPCGLLVSASWDGSLRVWQPVAQAPAAAQPAAASLAAGSGASAAGSTALVVAPPPRLTLAARHVMRGHDGRVLCLAPLGDVRVVSGGADGTARVWNCLMGTCERVLAGHAGPVGAVAVYPDDDAILSASADGSLRVWAPRSLAEAHVLVGHAGAVTACLALPGGVAVSGGADGTVRVWAPTGAAAAVLRGHSAAVTALAAVGPGLVASGGADDGLCTWDVAAGALVRLQGRRGREPNAPRFAAARTGPLAGASSGYWAISVPAGGALVALRAARGADVDGTLRMRFLTAGQLEEAAEADFEAELHGPPGRGASPKAAGSPKAGDAAGWEAHHAGSTALSARPARPGSPTTAHPTVAAAAAAAVTAAAGAAPRPGYAHAVHSFLALQDGRVAVTSDSPDVVLWDGGAGVVSARLTGHAERAWAAVELPARNMLATASWDTTLRLWDLEHDEVAAELKGHTGKVWCLAALDECRLVSGSWDGSVRLWDADVALAGGEPCLAVMDGHGCKVWALCALGEQHAVSGGVDGGLRVWDCVAGVCLHTLATGHAGPVAALAALGGGRVASGGWDGAVRVWDAQLGTAERVLSGHAGKVTALAPLGRGRVASASADGSVRVWDAAGGALLHTLVDHAGWVTHLADLGGGRFASAGADNALRIWDAESGRCQLVLSACDDETVYAVAAPGRSSATPGRYCFTLPLEGQAIAAVSQLM